MTLRPLDNNATIQPSAQDDEMRDFARVVRNALLMIVRYLEKRYRLI